MNEFYDIAFNESLTFYSYEFRCSSDDREIVNCTDEFFDQGFLKDSVWDRYAEYQYKCKDCPYFKHDIGFYFGDHHFSNDFSNKETSGTPSGSFEYEELIPRLEFVEENMVLACGETGFYTFQCGATVVQNHSQSFSGEAKSVFVIDDRIGVIVKNPEVAKEGRTVDKYKVQVYRFGGTKAGSFTFDFDYKAVNASDKDIIFYNDQECQIYSYRGHQKFQREFEHKIDSLLPGKTSGEYILLDQQTEKTITLK